MRTPAHDNTNLRPPGTRARARRRAFTLTEVLVALGAVAVISVGIAAVFQAVGETITRGNRVSGFTNAATRFEQQIRADLGGVTRNGFLVIRHELIAPANKRFQDYTPQELARLPALNEDDSNLRPRRADELLFFANGRFRSSRLVPNPRMGAESNAAMIYYGHGVRYPNDLLNVTPNAENLPNLQHAIPQIAASVDAQQEPRLRLGGDVTEDRGERGPNEFAGDWTLLRHVTVLRNPGETLTLDLSTAPGQTIYGFPYGNNLENSLRFQDTRVQIGGVPATPSVFNHYPFVFDQTQPDLTQLPARPLQPPRTAALALRYYSGVQRPSIPIMSVQNQTTRYHGPTIATGLIDVAGTDLAQIRRVVLGAPAEPGGALLDAMQDVVSRTGAQNVLGTSMALFDAYGVRNRFVQGVGEPFVSPTPDDYFGTTTELRRMQLWMLDALPGDALRAIGRTPAALPTGTGPDAGVNYRQTRARMRYELSPPAYFDMLNAWDSGTLPVDWPQNADQREFRIADQLMLASSVFLPRCTEFIVEWSFGNTWPQNGGGSPSEQGLRAGDFIWHGLYRRGDANFDGNIANTEFLAGPYPVFLGKNAGVEGAQYGLSWGGAANQFWPVTSELIHLDRNLPLLNNNAAIENIRVLESVFGYTDPTFLVAFQGDSAGLTAASNNRNRQLQNASGVPEYSTDVNARFRGPPAIPETSAGAPSSIPWAWPQLLRFTVTLADANDPRIEETFQFVVDLGSANRPN
ncbi:MAG: prepilin-type N-terminal cleavage/methylation domain-containing protein [Phycisphaerales bacterium]|nr:MAG: prepilin-type N-terminal cleavage/methylation domain-containing protein [Phycisphaerales bacterium]